MIAVLFRCLEQGTHVTVPRGVGVVAERQRDEVGIEHAYNAKVRVPGRQLIPACA